MKVKIRKGDTVQVITGPEDDKGRRGEVIRVLPKENRLVVQGVNIHTKHQKEVQTKGRRMQPGLVRFEAPIDVSNVMLICPKCSKPTRVGIVRTADGDAQRVCKKCEARFDE